MNCTDRHPARLPRLRPCAGTLLSLALLLPGCAAYQAAPLDLVRGTQAFDARRLDDPQLGAAVARMIEPPPQPWPPQGWNRAELLAVAMIQNPQLALARAEVRAAEAHEISAGESINPDLTLQSEYARHDARPWLYGVNLSWLLRSPQRRRLNREIARLETNAAGFELMERSWSLRRDLAAALSDWESARRRIVLLDSLAQAQNRLLAIATQRVDAGEDAPDELLFARQACLEIEQRRGETRAERAAAQAAAAQLLGLLPQALDGMRIDWVDWGDPPAAEPDRQRQMREQALLSRADIEFAIRAYSVAESKLKQAIMRQYPEITLGPGYYWDHGIAKFPFDVGFTLPLNRNRGEIGEALAARDIAAQRLLTRQAEIDGAIAAAERAESLTRTRAESAQQQYVSARKLADLAQLSTRLGASASQDSISSEIIATRAQLDLIQTRAQLQAARNALEDVLHMPISGPELALAQSWSSTIAEARR